MPYKIWVVGEEVLAADFNNYVQEQVVATFTNAAARDAAITGPNAGQLCYLTASNELHVYTGTAWSTLMSRWVSFTPNVLFGGTAVTIGAHDCAYRQVGGGWELVAAFTITAGGSSGDTAMRFILDATSGWVPTGGLAGYIHTVGIGTQMHTDGQVLTYAVSMENANDFIFRPTGYPSSPQTILATHVSAGDYFSFHVSYRAAIGVP